MLDQRAFGAFGFWFAEVFDEADGVFIDYRQKSRRSLAPRQRLAGICAALREDPGQRIAGGKQAILNDKNCKFIFRKSTNLFNDAAASWM